MTLQNGKMGSGCSRDRNGHHHNGTAGRGSAADGILKIVHFNDVYNIEDRDQEPVGGAARFVQKIQDMVTADPTLLVLFSGDAFNPSSMSTIFKGVQMVPVLNSCHISAAVYGNHDFDFGLDDLLELKEASNFPWLMTNVIDKETGDPLGNGEEFLILDHCGIKVGLLGLVELGWMETLSTIEMEEIVYTDYVEAADKYGQMLKEDEGCDIVIALTHMRWNNDRRLAASARYVDIVLGGHDHNYGVEEVNRRTIVKSGTDFRELSKITIRLSSEQQRMKTVVEKLEITSDLPVCSRMVDHVNLYLDKVSGEMEKVVGVFSVELETRFSHIRTRECNTGNFITDVMRVALKADIALLNSGTLRSDCVFPAGEIKMKDLKAILPILDELILIECTGAQIIEALENGVSKYPELEGRFPQVSGISFTFDPTREPGSRVLGETVRVNSDPIDLKRGYKVAVKEYISRGKDGYTVFAKAPRIGGEDDGPILDTLILNHFEEMEKKRQLLMAKRRIGTPKLSRNKSSSHRQHTILKSKNHEITEAHIQTFAPVVCGRINVVQSARTDPDMAIEDVR